MLKENICYWEDVGDVRKDNKLDHIEVIKQHVAGMENEIQEAVLSKESEEVALYISGYIVKKLVKRFNCNDCQIRLKSEENSIEMGYINLLNRGGLSIPSHDVCACCVKSFAILDVMHDVLMKHVPNTIRTSAEYLLNVYSPPIEFCCPAHISSGRKWMCRTVSNIYFNNEQNIANAEIRKDDIRKFKARQTEKR